MNYTGHGLLIIEKDKSVFVKINNDFIIYYRWLIDKRYYALNGQGTFYTKLAAKLQFPRLGAHISIVSNTFGNWKPEWNTIAPRGEKVSFEYNPEQIYCGGMKKGFLNFWMPVKSKQIDDLKRIIGVKDDKSYLGLHITIVNSKNLK